MKLKIINDFIASPFLVYDGWEPKKIIFKVKNEKGKVVDKLDLWKFSSFTIRKMSNEEQKELDVLLNLPRGTLSGDEEEIVSHFKDPFDSSAWPAYFAKTGNSKFVVYFVLKESQPARYICYVLAVLEKQE